MSFWLASRRQLFPVKKKSFYTKRIRRMLYVIMSRYGYIIRIIIYFMNGL